jgi:hypothetical protein
MFCFSEKTHLPRGERVLQKNKINENKNQKNKLCLSTLRGSLFVKSKCSRSEETISPKKTNLFEIYAIISMFFSLANL